LAATHQQAKHDHAENELVVSFVPQQHLHVVVHYIRRAKYGKLGCEHGQ